MGNENTHMASTEGNSTSSGQIPMPDLTLRLNGDRGFRQIIRRNRRDKWYTHAERARAIKLMDGGATSRQAAEQIGAPCCSSTVIRWRQEARRRAAWRHRRYR